MTMQKSKRSIQTKRQRNEHNITVTMPAADWAVIAFLLEEEAKEAKFRVDVVDDFLGPDPLPALNGFGKKSYMDSKKWMLDCARRAEIIRNQIAPVVEEQKPVFTECEERMRDKQTGELFQCRYPVNKEHPCPYGKHHE